MNNRKNGFLRERVWKLYDYIQAEFYLNRPDQEIKGRPYNSALLMSLLTGLCQGKELIIGEPGLGKTTSAEYISALLYRFPMGTVWKSEVSGHPEQTEEKIIGRPDLGELNQGKEVVIWSYFALLPVKIVDEINRLPETKQSIILDGVDRGKWEYLDDAIINREFCLFATANYQDRGTNTIIAPLMDRFDVMVESKHPGPNLAYQIGLQGANGQALRHETLEQAFHRTLSERLPYPVRMEQVEALCDRFGEILAQEIGLQTLSSGDRQAIREEKEKIPLDLDVNAFLRLVLSELSFCYRFGQKRSHEVCEEGCHYTGYLCNAIQNCSSNRFPISVRTYSQALAWLLGNEEVDLEHLMAVLPFALSHRIEWKEEALALWGNEFREDPLPIFMAKKALSEMHRRYMEQAPQIKNALSVACRIAEGEALDPIQGDHPIYWEISKDLAKEVLKA
ncbi:MAG: AAA family ATPase [Desulfobacteraceae bacterium]|jgi:MoxR-like ATPase